MSSASPNRHDGKTWTKDSELESSSRPTVTTNATFLNGKVDEALQKMIGLENQSKLFAQLIRKLQEISEETMDFTRPRIYPQPAALALFVKKAGARSTQQVRQNQHELDCHTRAWKLFLNTLAPAATTSNCCTIFSDMERHTKPTEQDTLRSRLGDSDARQRKRSSQSPSQPLGS